MAIQSTSQNATQAYVDSNNRFRGYYKEDSKPINGLTLKPLKWVHKIFNGQKGVPNPQADHVLIEVNREQMIKLIEQAKRLAWFEAEAKHNKRAATGFNTGQGFNIPFMDSDVSQLTTIQMSLDTQVVAGADPNTLKMQLTASNNQFYEIQYLLLKQLAPAYSAAHATSKEQQRVEYETKIAELDAIEIPPVIEDTL